MTLDLMRRVVGLVDRLLGPLLEGDQPRLWPIASELCQLTDLRETRVFGSLTALTGRSGPWRLRFTRYERDRVQSTRVVVEGAGDQADLGGVSLRPEDVGTALERRLGRSREIELGDESFDQAFYVEGPTPRVRAVLDAETRRLLLWLTGDVRLEVAEGELRAELRDNPSHSLADGLTRVLPRLLEAADRLNRPPDAAARLADIALRDPLTLVRLETLLTLVREYPEHPGTRDTLHAACSDHDLEIQLRAAMALGTDGHPTLLRLASSAPDAYAARAVAVMHGRLEVEPAREILQQALRARRVETARACLRALGRHPRADVLELLVKVLRVESGELAVTAAHALGDTHLPGAETPLLATLASSSDDLRLAAVEALGRLASVEAVLPLKEIEDKHSYDGALRRAARQAIAQIQSRAGGASPGQLSLAAGESGQLSLAGDDAAGQLSLPAGDVRGGSPKPPTD